jgi:NRPS condensation-like uncharacterized protein
MTGLNHYQQLMLRFSRLAPYNAIHSVLMTQKTFDPVLLQQAVHQTVLKLGLGRPHFSADFQKVEFSHPTEPIRIESSEVSLVKHIETEMNRAFAIEDIPVRFFVIIEDSRYYFSLTYDHWIGDAYSISRLMGMIFSYMNAQKTPELTLAAPSIEACFQSIYKKRMLFYRYVGVIQSFFRFSSAFRPPISDETQTESGCQLYCFEKEMLPQLRVICKAQSITLNDLFLTVLAQIFGQVTEEQRANLNAKRFKPKRDRIVIAVIANIRNKSQFSLSAVFGLFLGFFYLSFKSPEQTSFQDLSQAIHKKTQKAKNKHSAIKQYLLFKVQRNRWDRCKQKSKYRLFSKATPITVGLSNLDLNQSEAVLVNSAHHYVRVSPTSMVCPIVFNLTTFNDTLSLGVNFRKACFTIAVIEQIKQAFIAQLNEMIKA